MNFKFLFLRTRTILQFTTEKQFGAQMTCLLGLHILPLWIAYLPSILHLWPIRERKQKETVYNLLMLILYLIFYFILFFLFFLYHFVFAKVLLLLPQPSSSLSSFSSLSLASYHQRHRLFLLLLFFLLLLLWLSLFFLLILLWFLLSGVFSCCSCFVALAFSAQHCRHEKTMQRTPHGKIPL